MAQKHKLNVKFTERKDLKTGLYGDGAGLYLQVSRLKTKSWVFRFMIRGKSRKMGLGDFDRVTLAQARGKATEAHLLTVDGVDPIDARNERRASAADERAKALTFKECAEKYISMREPSWKNPKSGDQWRASLKTYAYPVMGSEPVAAIDKVMVLKVLQPIWQTKTVTATRVRARIEAVLDWARAVDLRRGDNPAEWSGYLEHLLPSPSAVSPVSSHAALLYAELPAFMEDLRDKDGVSALALEWTILTVARTADTTGARWREIDLKERTWTVPGERLKGKRGKPRRDHVVPLCDRAIEILEIVPTEGDFIFPGQRAGAGLSGAAMDQMLKGMGYAGDRATVHGFRSTFKDWAADQTHYPNELTEMAMAHAISNKVEAAYRRSDMREKRRRLMQDWSDYCAGRGVTGDNVVSIGARA